MSRPRAFEETTVLNGAMAAFREHGYAGVSVRDLERATGVSAGSLYNAYGDKEGVYRAAFAHYFDTIIDPRLGPATTLEDLEQLFLGLFEMPSVEHGCLVTNAAIEFGPAPSLAADLIVRGLDALEGAFSAVLEREIGAEAARTASLRLVLLYEGLLVLFRAGRCTPALVPVIRSEFADLRALRPEGATSSQEAPCSPP